MDEMCCINIMECHPSIKKNKGLYSLYETPKFKIISMKAGHLRSYIA
jgi:hypothetical protein